MIIIFLLLQLLSSFSFHVFAMLPVVDGVSRISHSFWTHNILYKRLVRLELISPTSIIAITDFRQKYLIFKRLYLFNVIILSFFYSPHFEHSYFSSNYHVDKTLHNNCLSHAIIFVILFIFIALFVSLQNQLFSFCFLFCYLFSWRARPIVRLNFP